MGRSRHLSTKRGLSGLASFYRDSRPIYWGGWRRARPAAQDFIRPQRPARVRSSTHAALVLPRAVYGRADRGGVSPRVSRFVALRGLLRAVEAPVPPSPSVVARVHTRVRAFIHAKRVHGEAGINSLSDYPVRAKALTVVPEPHL